MSYLDLCKRHTFEIIGFKVLHRQHALLYVVVFVQDPIIE